MTEWIFDPVPFEAAVEFFESKGYALGFDYRDIWQAEHQRSFTVAKAMQLDLLQDLRNAVDDAIDQGVAFKDFHDKLEPILRERGWWGPAQMADPLTGEARDVQLGSYARLEIIYDTNLRTSYSEGAWEQVQRTKDQLPFLRYVDPSGNPRPEHLAWSGTIVRADDPWVASHWPPGGWH